MTGTPEGVAPMDVGQSVGRLLDEPILQPADALHLNDDGVYREPYWVVRRL